jgi:hypothetical protein
VKCDAAKGYATDELPLASPHAPRPTELLSGIASDRNAQPSDAPDPKIAKLNVHSGKVRLSDHRSLVLQSHQHELFVHGNLGNIVRGMSSWRENLVFQELVSLEHRQQAALGAAKSIRDSQAKSCWMTFISIPDLSPKISAAL